MTKIWTLASILGACLLLQACSTGPVTTDELPQLKPGEGIAGISFDSSWELKGVEFDGISGGGKLFVPDVPAGQSAFLFVTPAGKYCLERYTLAQDSVTKDTRKNDRCFEVEVGKLSYSGTFIPHFDTMQVMIGVRNLDGYMAQEDEPRAFLNALSINYPHIAAAAFPTGSDRSVSDLAPPAKPDASGLCSVLSQGEASELLGKPVQAGQESNLYTIDTCNFMHSDDESVHLLVFSGDDRSTQFKGTSFEAPATGATDWTPVPSLGEKAGFGCKKSNCEVDILWQKRVLALVVDGTDRKDIADAMTTIAHKVFDRWQALPSASAEPPPKG